jgi:hypothetical protein
MEFQKNVHIQNTKLVTLNVSTNIWKPFFKVTFSVDQTYAVEIPGIVADRSINSGLSVGRVNVAFIRTFTTDETNYQDV